MVRGCCYLTTSNDQHVTTKTETEADGEKMRRGRTSSSIAGQESSRWSFSCFALPLGDCPTLKVVVGRFHPNARAGAAAVPELCPTIGQAWRQGSCKWLLRVGVILKTSINTLMVHDIGSGMAVCNLETTVSDCAFDIYLHEEFLGSKLLLSPLSDCAVEVPPALQSR